MAILMALFLSSHTHTHIYIQRHGYRHTDTHIHKTDRYTHTDRQTDKDTFTRSHIHANWDIVLMNNEETASNPLRR